jgi:regulator of sigma E protease
LGGIIVNILVAAFAYMIIFGTWGEDFLPTQNAKYGIAADSTARSIGLQNGDMIVGVDGKPVERFGRIVPSIILEEGKTIQVRRGGQEVNIAIPSGTIRSIIKSQRGTFILPRIPVVVDEVAKSSAAEKMGLKSGDSIIAVNGQPTPFFDQYEEMKKGLKGQPIQLTVVRKGAVAQLGTTLPQDGTLVFFPVRELERFFHIEKVRYSPVAAIGKGFSYAFEQFGSYGQQLKLLFTSKEVKLSESVGGLITFGKSAPQTFEWESFLRYLALISIILAFMNLLPIPGLDGGYVFFLLWEMITGRKVSDKVMERATTVGLVLLLGLMLYANGLDIFRLFKK